jgi:lipoic acid synthetase
VPEGTTKSGFMLGLGETRDEIFDLLRRLRDVAVDVVTIGQYLRPSRENLPVEEYVPPEVFEEYREAGEAMGFRHVFSGPFVRSSYRAEEALHAAHAARRPVIPRPEGPRNLGPRHSEEQSEEESLACRERDPSLRSG